MISKRKNLLGHSPRDATKEPFQVQKPSDSFKIRFLSRGCRIHVSPIDSTIKLLSILEIRHLLEKIEGWPIVSKTSNISNH